MTMHDTNSSEKLSLHDKYTNDTVLSLSDYEYFVLVTFVTLYSFSDGFF